MSGMELFSGIVQGFANARERQQLQEQDKKERDAKLKLFEIQLQREQAQNAQLAQKQDLLNQLTNGTSAPQDGNQAWDMMGAGQSVQSKGLSLVDMLADPQTAMKAVRAGIVDVKDIIQLQNQQRMQELIKGASSGQSPKGFELTGFKQDSSGNIMPDFSAPQAWKEIPSPDGRFMVTIDKQMREMSRRPIGPGERSKEDLPLDPSQLMSFVDESGNPPPPGISLREIQARGYKPVSGSKVTPEEAGKISAAMQAREIGKEVYEKFYKEDGTIDRAAVFNAYADTPYSEGRNIRNQLKVGFDAILRLRTGAGVNNQEMKDVFTQFLPNPLDDDATIANKSLMYQKFVDGTLDIATLPPSIRERLQKAKKSEAQKQEGGKVIDFSSLPK